MVKNDDILRIGDTEINLKIIDALFVVDRVRIENKKYTYNTICYIVFNGGYAMIVIDKKFNKEINDFISNKKQFHKIKQNIKYTKNFNHLNGKDTVINFALEFGYARYDSLAVSTPDTIFIKSKDKNYSLVEMFK